MSDVTTSTYMSLPVPIVGQDAGPQYATDLNNCLTLIDMHTHATGSGTQITPNGININADLPFGTNSATGLLKTSFTSQTSALTGTNFLSFISGNLYVNDGSGNQIPITSGGGVAGSPGTIGSLVAPASATYSAGSKTFTWLADSSKSAAMDNGAVIIRETNVASAKGITIASPTSLGADYQITLLTALPGSTQALNMTSSGNLGTISYDSIGSSMTLTGANAIAATMTTTGTTSIFNTGATWTTFTPTLAKNTGSGTLTSSSVTYARYLKIGKLLHLQVKIVSINIATAAITLKFTSPYASAGEVKIPIWTQNVLTSAIGRLATVASSTEVDIGTGIDGGGFSVGTTSEFTLSVSYETT